MMTGSGSEAVAGGPARHIPVLAASAIGWLAVRSGGIYLDATFGGGGYTRAILQTSGARVIAIDRDHDSIAAGEPLVRETHGRLALAEGLFCDLDLIAAQHGAAGLDGVVFDLGISSMHIDNPARGFSFRLDGPLDMRMGRSAISAADVIRHASERELASIIAVLGEERHARAIARALVEARAVRAIDTTRALAQVVTRAIRTREGTIHPATRTFQALRIFVNDELSELARGLAAAERALKPSGRLVVVAFHSLEDRIVKNFLASRSRAPASSRHRPQPAALPASFRVLTRRPITPDEAEIAANPRARSAKLRAAERTGVPPHSAPNEVLVPPLPALGDIMRGRA
jgi:16S rRNA (cytosine1402-N4)-methyltransferase